MNASSTHLTEQCIPIMSDIDVIEARGAARALATRVGFTGVDPTLIASAVSEIARNIVEYAGPGEIILSVVWNHLSMGLQVVARDQGPGIADVSSVMRGVRTTSRGLGRGLRGSQRLMDEFRVESSLGQGTTITMRKWLP